VPSTPATTATLPETGAAPPIDLSGAPTATCEEPASSTPPAEPPADPIGHLDYGALEGESWVLEYRSSSDSVERRVAGFAPGPDGDLIVLEHSAEVLPVSGGSAGSSPAATDLALRRLSATGETVWLAPLGPSSWPAPSGLAAQADGSTLVVWGRRAPGGGDPATEAVTSTMVEADGTLGPAEDLLDPAGGEYEVSVSAGGTVLAADVEGGVDVRAFGPQGDPRWVDRVDGASLAEAAAVADDGGATVIAPDRVHRIAWDGAVLWQAGAGDPIWQVGDPAAPANRVHVVGFDWFGADEPPFRLSLAASGYPTGHVKVCEIASDGTGAHATWPHQGTWDGVRGLALRSEGPPRYTDHILESVGEAPPGRLRVGFSDYAGGQIGWDQVGPRLTDGAIVLAGSAMFVRLAAPAGDGDLSNLPDLGPESSAWESSFSSLVPLRLDD
jgi:hypothetical protein